MSGSGGGPMCDAVEWSGPVHPFTPVKYGHHTVCKICGMLEGTGLNGGTQHTKQRKAHNEARPKQRWIGGESVAEGGHWERP